MQHGGGEEATVAEILGELALLEPVDEREAVSIARIAAELPSMVDPFSQDRGPLHVTASAVVVHPAGTVLHRHRKLGLWLQPGGHVEAGEHPREAALRECAEETGVVGYVPASHEGLLHVDVHPGPRGHTHLDLRYLIACDAPTIAPAPGESEEVMLLTFDEARALADEGLLGALVRAEEQAALLWQGKG